MTATDRRRLQMADEVTDWLRPTSDEVQALRRIEVRDDAGQYHQAARDLERKYETRRLIDSPNLAGANIVPTGLLRADAALSGVTSVSTAKPASSVAVLVEEEKVQCPCLHPFQFRSTTVTGDAIGEDLDQTRQGVLGVASMSPFAYGLIHQGDDTGTTRTSRTGNILIEFAADLKPGLYYLIVPNGYLVIHGHSRVVGHGNYSTSYDAKVWVKYATFVLTPGNVIETSTFEVHYDATRSEDREKNFDYEFDTPERVVRAVVPDTGGSSTTLYYHVLLNLRCDANSDGLALIDVDSFGFLSNATWDHNTIVIRASN